MAKKTVVIVDHPSFDRSNAHRRFVEEMRKYPDDILIHNLQSAYPTGTIDVANEHCLIDNNGSIVFEFPIYWFTCPPKTKEWLDKVLTHDWAFKDGHHLKGRKIGLCVTCGSEEEAYTAQGRHHRSIEEYLASMQRAFEMCDADYVGTFALYGINDAKKVDAEASKRKAEERERLKTEESRKATANLAKIDNIIAQNKERRERERVKAERDSRRKW